MIYQIKDVFWRQSLLECLQSHFNSFC